MNSLTAGRNAVLSIWFSETVCMVHQQGYRVTPVYKGGCTQPYSNGQTYPDPTAPEWEGAIAVGVVLDDAVLLDYDGNKAAGDIISLNELAPMLGLDDMPQAAQENTDGDSLHFLFKRPEGFQCKASNDGWRPHIDVKTGNQLMHLKPGKVINDNELPRPEELPAAPQLLLDALASKSFDAAPRDPWDGSDQQVREAREILSYVSPNLPYDQWVNVLMGIHERFGDSAEGIELADEWCREGNNYCGRKVLAYKFGTFNDTAGITFASVCEMAKTAGADLATLGQRAFDDLMEDAAKLKAGDDVTELIEDAAHLKPVELDRLFRLIKQKTGDNLGALRAQRATVLSDKNGPALDQLGMARAVVKDIGAQNMLSVKSGIFRWSRQGVWQGLCPRAVKVAVQGVIPDIAKSVSANLVAGVSDLLATEVFSKDHEFNVGATDVVNCPNGQLTLVDGSWELLPHRREDYRTTQIPVTWDESAECPKFAVFLQSVFEGTPDQHERIRCVLECMGYTLMAHCRYEVMVMLVGNGANGKSVLLSVLEELVGSSNVSGVQPSQLDRTFQRSHLHQKLANIVTEVKEGEIMADNAVKAIVSGETCTVERKLQHPFDMKPFATLWMGTNHMPHSRDFSDGFFRRAMVLDFPNQFKPELNNCDPHLRDKLTKELPGILKLCLGHYAAAVERGSILVPDSVVEQREAWRRESDHVQVWVEEDCDVGPGMQAAVADLYEAYKEWAGEAGIQRRVTRATLGKRLKALGYEPQRTGNERFYSGIQLKRLVDPRW